MYYMAVADLSEMDKILLYSGSRRVLSGQYWNVLICGVTAKARDLHPRQLL